MSPDPRHICLRCPHVQPPPYTGACACTIDDRDIIEHYEARYCPLGRFRLGLGDWIARLFHVIGLRRLVSFWAALTRKQCGCAKRVNQINGRWHGLYVWLLDWAAVMVHQCAKSATNDSRKGE